VLPERQVSPRRALAGYGAAVVGVAAVTWLISLAPARLPAHDLEGVYLLLVLALAAAAGSSPAIAASVLAFLAFDWFFVPPVGRFTVDDPAEWLSLVVFLVVGISTGSLAAGLRRRAEEARRLARETTTLYELSTAILGDASLERILEVIVERMAATLELAGAAILLRSADGRLDLAARFVGDSSTADAGAPAVAQGAFDDLLHGHAGLRLIRPLPRALDRSGEAAAQLQGIYTPIVLGERPLGVLVAYLPLAQPVLDDDALRLLDAIAAQAALAVGRARLAAEEERAHAAAESERLKSVFLASVSHDLRTPLTAIKASAGQLLAAPAAERDVAEAALSIDREVDRLNRLVGNVLEMSRIEASAQPPHTSPEELAELVGAAVQRVLPLLDERRIAVTIDESLPLLQVDAAQIDRLLTNLLENAAKFSPPRARISLSAGRRDAEVVLRVHNPGPAIPESEQQHIFDKFYRLGGLAGERRGTGLGLAICKGIAEAHGGRIWTRNESAGVAFYVALPISSEIPAVAALTP
jgi:two-component system sensor histidine kinase KdpD